MTSSRTLYNAARSNISDVSEETMNRVFSVRHFEKSVVSEFVTYDFKECKINCFSGNNRLFTPTSTNGNSFEIDGVSYNSLSDYLCEMKFRELVGSSPPTKEERGDVGFSMFLQNNRVNKAKIEKWFLTRGLLYLQKAILRRCQTDELFYDKLISTEDDYIVYSYAKDPFLGTGQRLTGVQNWAQGIASEGLTVRVPKKFPITFADLPYLPSIIGGRNVLGTCYMALREQLKFINPMHLEVEIPVLVEPPPIYPNDFVNLQRKRRLGFEEYVQPKRMSPYHPIQYQPIPQFDPSIPPPSPASTHYSVASPASTYSYRPHCSREPLLLTNFMYFKKPGQYRTHPAYASVTSTPSGYESGSSFQSPQASNYSSMSNNSTYFKRQSSVTSDHYSSSNTTPIEDDQIGPQDAEELYGTNYLDMPTPSHHSNSPPYSNDFAIDVENEIQPQEQDFNSMTLEELEKQRLQLYQTVQLLDEKRSRFS